MNNSTETETTKQSKDETKFAVAEEILNQLGGRLFLMMTGAKNLVGSDNSLSLKIGRNPKGVTHVRITLTPMDVYTLTFIKVRGTNLTVTFETTDIYHDQLREVFEENTGLYTKL